jgi:hypothetical protein
VRPRDGAARSPEIDVPGSLGNALSRHSLFSSARAKHESPLRGRVWLYRFIIASAAHWCTRHYVTRLCSPPATWGASWGEARRVIEECHIIGRPVQGGSRIGAMPVDCRAKSQELAGKTKAREVRRGALLP